MSVGENRQRQADELILVESMFPNEFCSIVELDHEQVDNEPDHSSTRCRISYNSV